jgi:hypothetical protein
MRSASRVNTSTDFKRVDDRPSLLSGATLSSAESSALLALLDVSSLSSEYLVLPPDADEEDEEDEDYDEDEEGLDEDDEADLDDENDESDEDDEDLEDEDFADDEELEDEELEEEDE